MSARVQLRLFTIFSIILLCISSTVKSLQNDTFYIIKLGGDILNNGIDLMDHYCWITELTYTYPHWLYDVFLYLVYTNFNYLGVYLSTMFLFIILILSIYVINLKINKNEIIAMIVSFVSLSCLIGFATARAQLVTAILFLWQVYFIEKLIDSGKKKYVLFLVLISLLVANLHATIWPFYFILFLPFIGQHFIYVILNFRKKSNELVAEKLVISKIEHFKELIVTMFLGFLMGFLSPSRICFTYIFKVMQGSSQSYIIEHAPMILIKNPIFLVFILVLLLILVFSKTKIKLKELFMLGGLIFMCLSSVRHVNLFYILGLLYISILCSRYLCDMNDKTLDMFANLFVKNKIIYFLSFIFIIFLSYYKFNDNFSYDYLPKDEYPIEAINFIKEKLDITNMRLYNDYNIGSYLLFNDIPVFIDSRCDLYLKEFNGLDYSIFDDAMNIEYNYEEKFEFYDVTHVLISKTDILYFILSKNQDYKLIYTDDNYILFEKV